MSRRYHVSDAADFDLFEIVRHIGKHSHSGADRMIDRLHAKFSDIAEHPGMGRQREDISPGMRSFVVANYVVLYVAREDEVTIIRVLHGARNIKAIMRPTDAPEP